MSSELSRSALVRAAEMRDAGATWNEIRAELGVTTQSARFQELWEREGIPHMPSRDLGTAARLATLEANRGEREATKGASPASWTAPRRR